MVTNKSVIVCPICEGHGSVIDKHTHRERDCVACTKGVVRKGNKKSGVNQAYGKETAR